LGFSLSGGKKWIGSMECAALLRSFGINCTVVDFFRATGADGTHPELLKWVWDYFSSFYSPPSPRCPDSITSPTLDALLLLPSSPAPLPNVHSASSFASILKRPEHKRLLSNTAKSLEAQQKSHKASRSPSPTFSPLLYSPTFVPPIFFQHEGHSRTIVGIEKRKNGTLHLLILDPVHTGQKVTAALASRQRRIFRHSLSGLKHRQYQLVAVEAAHACRLMTFEEMQNSKVLRTVRIPATSLGRG